MRMKIMLCAIMIILLVGTAYALTENQRENLERTLELAKNDKVKYERVLQLLEKKNINLMDEANLSKRIHDDMERLGIKGYENLKIEMPSPKDRYAILWIFMPIILAVPITLCITELKRKRNKTLRLKELAELHSVHEPHDDHEKLMRYMDECLHFGYTSEHIQKILLGYGWQPEQIQKFISEVQVLRYANNAVQQGYDLGTVRNQLLKVNWEQNIVDDALGMMKG